MSAGMSAGMGEARLLELFEAWIDDEVTPGEARELRALVDDDPALRARFVAEARWQVRLSAELRAPALPLADRVAAQLEGTGRARRTADAVAGRLARSSRRRAVAASSRRRASALRWGAALAAGLLACVGLLWNAQRVAPSAATVEGDGTIERNGLAVALTADGAAQALRDGDVIVAGPGEVLLRFADGTDLDLAEGGRLALRSGASAGGKRLDLERGALLARVARQPAGSPLVIGTPQARATVLGTTFRLAVAEAGTRLTVDEGLVGFARGAGGAALSVGAGRTADAGADGSLAFVGSAPAPVAITRAAWTPVPFGPGAGRPFSDASPYNTPIPPAPVLDAESAPMVARLGAHPAALALWTHAVPVYDADATTPVRTVTATKPWGRSPYAGHQVRVPDGARPNGGVNRSLVVVDWGARRTWEFFGFAWDGADVRTHWGGTLGIDGDGVAKPSPGWSGGSHIAGLVRVHDIRQGVIPHALVFGTSFARKGAFRSPSYQSDGKLTGADTIPVGARIQLDPALDLDGLPGLTPGERIIAEALQTYGAYCVGASGQPFLVFCELAPDASGPRQPGAVYRAAGLAGEDTTLTHIPFTALRVLQRWDGGDGAPR